MLRLLKLPDYVKNDIANGTLTVGHARCLLSVGDEPGDLKQLHDKIISKNLSVRQTEELVKNHKEFGARQNRSKKKPPGNIATPYRRALAGALHDYLGSPARIVQNGAQGKIVITYSSPQDLERIMGLIIKDREEARDGHNRTTMPLSGSKVVTF